jgi:hypothetical protein
MRFRRHRCIRTAIATLPVIALTCGCGLSEYEGLMASEQARVRRIDEENKLLGDPIEWPEKKEGEKGWVDVFFRPPKGISAKKPKQHGPLWVYARSEDTGSILEVWVGAAVNQSDFVKDVFKLFRTDVEKVSKSTNEKSPPGRKEPLVFEARNFDDNNSAYSINVYRKGSIQAVVIFKMDRKGSDATARDMSLESLAVEMDAVDARKVYNRHNLKARGK